MSSNFPTIQEILAVHQDLIEQFGGSHGLRDMGALESALFRPQMGYYDSLIEEAAALMESLAMNHPFIDGNKRVAFFVTAAFLMQNGHFIECDSREAYDHFHAPVRHQLLPVRGAEGLAGGTRQASPANRVGVGGAYR